jgi:hypothetical protein
MGTPSELGLLPNHPGTYNCVIMRKKVTHAESTVKV